MHYPFQSIISILTHFGGEPILLLIAPAAKQDIYLYKTEYL